MPNTNAMRAVCARCDSQSGIDAARTFSLACKNAANVASALKTQHGADVDQWPAEACDTLKIAELAVDAAQIVLVDALAAISEAAE